ncbi:hypothetical protein L1987_20462 [Smallanthus sonchifolius]|uniref:Uncharacterized protein n=1 Tax=Smallanthus sonchifolius TaxID=185202 RepID=A0ACB9IS41_9ASTR|nr:hypothetical protein L1987_20462 [Smallanthus sonchifolius]
MSSGDGESSSRASLPKVSSDKDVPTASTDNDGIKSQHKEQHKVNNDVSKSDVPMYDEDTTTENINREAVPPIFNDYHVNRDSSKSGEELVTLEETEAEENHPTDSGQDVLLEDKGSENKEGSQCVNSDTSSKDISPKVGDLKTQHELVENKYQEHTLITSPKNVQDQLESPKKIQDEPASPKKVQHQPRKVPDQPGSTKKVEDQLDEAQGLLESSKTTGQSKEARLEHGVLFLYEYVCVCAGLSSRLQEYKSENAQLEELLVAEEKVNIMESSMLEALGAKNAEIKSLVSSMDTLKKQAALSEGNLASLQANMELIIGNRELTETRMMQALKEELSSAERRAEEERAAHNATKMAAMEREVELEHRALDASTALAKIQVEVERSRIQRRASTTWEEDTDMKALEYVAFLFLFLTIFSD